MYYFVLLYCESKFLRSGIPYTYYRFTFDHMASASFYRGGTGGPVSRGGGSKHKTRARSPRISQDDVRDGVAASGGEDSQTSHWATARAKMDVSKALAIMGFSSSRTLDHDARGELHSALARQMEMLGKGKELSVIEKSDNFLSFFDYAVVTNWHILTKLTNLA